MGDVTVLATVQNIARIPSYIDTVDTVVVPVTEVSNSNAMEKEGFKRLLFSFCLVLHINIFFRYRSSHQRSYM